MSTDLPAGLVKSVGTCLAFVAGSVDCTGLLAAGHFAAHLTGTMTHLSADLAHSAIASAGYALLVTLAFLSGAILAGSILASRTVAVARTTLAIMIALETGLIGGGGLLLAATRPLALSGVAPPMAIALFAIAMGIQNASSSTLLGVFARTTHLTSNLTDLGVQFGVRLRALLQVRLGDPARNPSATPKTGHMPFFALAIAGFAAGALVAAILLERFGPALAPALAVLPALASLWLFRPGRADGMRSADARED